MSFKRINANTHISNRGDSRVGGAKTRGEQSLHRFHNNTKGYMRPGKRNHKYQSTTGGDPSKG